MSLLLSLSLFSNVMIMGSVKRCVQNEISPPSVSLAARSQLCLCLCLCLFCFTVMITNSAQCNGSPPSVSLAARSQLPCLQHFVRVWNPSNITFHPDSTNFDDQDVIKASEILVAPRILECFGLPWSALVCYSLPWTWSALDASHLTSSSEPFGRSGCRCKPLDFVLRALRALRPVGLL